MKKMFATLIITSIIGVITVIFSLAISTISDGDVNHGRVTDIYRNENFFASKSKIMNSILILPRYFLKVCQNPYKIQTNMEVEKEGYGSSNLFFGILAMLLLFLTASIYDRSGIVGKIFSLSYTFYWSLVTIFMYIQFFAGISLFTSNTWG